MNSLELTTLLSVFATSLMFGCSPAPERGGSPGDLDDADVPALNEEPTDDDDATDASTDDDDATDSDDDDATDSDDDDATDSDDDDATDGDDDDAIDSDDDDATDSDDDDATGDAPIPVLCTDAFEENDELATAWAMTPADHAGLTVCADDEDWYGFELLAGDNLSAAITFLHADGDVDLKFVDAADTTLDSSTSTGDGEDVTATVDADGTYFVKVYRFGGAGEPAVDYDLSVEVGLPPSCPIDGFEDNDADTAAVPVSPGLNAALSVCEDDVDWYAFDVTEGQTVVVDAFFSDAEGDVDLHLTAPDGTAAVGSTSVDDDESAEVVGAMAGTWLLKVSLWRDDGTTHGNEYDLDLTVQ
jgi:hypothetical protein